MKALLSFFMIVISLNLYSADTTESFEHGFTDYEYYFNMSNLSKDKKMYSNQITVGLGITRYLSSSLSVSSDKYDKTVTNTFGFGLFSTLFDSKYFDFDLYGGMDSLYSMTLGLELNFDLEDEMAFTGIYFRFERISLDDISDYSILLGYYYTIFEDIQLLLEFDMLIPENDDFNIGELAFGVNYALNHKIEFISEFKVDIPQDDEELNYSFVLGFIGTLP